MNSRPTSASILVIGDPIIDIFRYAKVEDNPDYGAVPAIRILKQTQTAGGAANLLNNLMNFNISVDYLAPICKKLLQLIGHKQTLTNSTNVLPKINPNYWYEAFSTYQIVRFIDQIDGSHILRINEKTRIKYTPTIDTINSLGEPFYSKLIDLLQSYQAIIISDYEHGLITTDLIEFLIKTIPSTTRIYVDSARPHLLLQDITKKLYLLKVNEKEKNNIPSSIQHNFLNVITTLGENGARIEGQGRFAIQNKVDVIDSCGCGDTFLAGLVYAHEICNKDLTDSIKYAIAAATVSVMKQNVSTANQNEIMKLLDTNQVIAKVKGEKEIYDRT